MPEPTKNKVDFIPLFANGMTTNQILDYAKKNNAEIYLSDPETAKTQYKDAINPDQFDSFYSLAQEGYNNYRKGEWNGNVAESWMYRAPSVTLQRLGYGDAFIQPDKNMPVVEGRYGYDIEGNQVATPEEIADNLGYIINDKTGEKEPFSHGKVQSALNIAKSVASIVEDFALPGMVNENMGNGKVVNGLYGDEIPYLAYNEEGLPEWRKAKKSDIKDTMLIRSAIGPQPMQRSYVSALIKNFYNIIPQIVSTIGSVENTIDDLYDNMVYGKDMPGYLEAIGKQLQSTGAALSFKGSQRAQEGNIFNNKEALFSGLGQVLGQVLLQYATAGMAGAAGMGSSAAMWTANGVFGAMAMDSFAQQARHLGIPEEDIAWMGPVIGASEAFVEGIIGPNIITKGSDAIVHRNAMKEAIETETKKMIEAVGEKVPSNLSKSQKFQLARNISKAIGRIGETLYSEKTALGRLGITAIEEGSEEIPSQFNQNLLQTLYDIDKNAHDPFVQPGEGMFGEVDRNNYSETFLNRIPDGMAESFVLGFLGGAGGALTSRQIFANHQEDTITDFIAKGKTDKLVDHMNSMYKKGELDVPFLDTDGNPIPVGSEGQVKSMNDLAYETLKNKIEVYDQLAKQYKITDSATLKAVGGDFSFLKNALFTAKEVNNARARLQEIQNNQQATEEEKAEIPVLQQTIVSGEQAIQNIVNPEHENTKYSKAYNDYLKTRRSLTDLAIKENNLDSSSKNPEQYFKALTAFISNYSPDLYQNTRLFNSDGLRAYNTAKTAEYETRVKAREEARQNYVNKVSSLTSEGANENEILATLNNRLSDIEAGNFEFAKTDHDLADLDKKITDIMAPLQIGNRKKVKDLINEALMEGGDLSEEDLQGTGYEGLKPGDYEKTLEELNGILNPADLSVKMMKSIRDKFNTPVSPIQTPNPETLFKSHYTDDVEKEYGVVEDAINRNLEGYNPNVIEQSIDNNLKTLKERKQMLKVGNTTLQAINKESGNDHISKEDRIVTDGEAKEIGEKIDSLIGKLTGLKGQVGIIAGQRSVRQQKLKQVHLEYVRRSLEIIITGKIANDFPKLKELYNKLIPIPKESMTMDSVLSEQDKAAIVENEKIINEIETIYKQNIDKTFSKEWYQGIIKTNFISNLKNSYQTLMGRSDYQGDYEVSFVKELSNSITSSSIGYNYFVSYMNRLTGPAKNDITKARLDIYSENPGENISSYEQEQAEESGLAHLGKKNLNVDDTSVLLMTVNAEIDVINDKIKEAKEGEEKKGLNATLNELKKNKDNLILKSMYLRGEYKTGKTQHVLPRIFQLYGKVFNRRIEKVYVVGHTDFIRDSITRSLSNVMMKQGDDEMALIEQIIPLDTRKAFKTDFGNSIVIWDEASLLTSKHLKKLQKHLESATTIFMGDNSQMQPVSDFSLLTGVNYVANRTIPLLSKYSTDYPFITQLTNAFRDSRNGKNLEESLPMLYTEKKESTGELIGGHYYESENDIRKSFVERMSDPSNTTRSQALVFLDNKQYNDWADQYKGKTGNDNPVERYAKNIFVLDYDVEKGIALGMPESIQGNRVDEVYIADDIMNLDKLFPSNGNKNFALSAIAGYTAVGRALNYVAIKGPAAKNSTTKTWTDSNIKGETIEKEREQERTQRIEQLKGIYNKNYTQAPKSQIDNKEKKSDTKRGKGDIDKGEWKDLENTDFLTTAHKNGKSIVKVGDNFIDQKKIVHQVERFMTFQKDGSTSFFVVFDDGTKVDIKYLVDYDYVEDIDDEVTNRRSFKEQAQHVTDNVKAIWGTVYSVFMGTGTNDTLNERERQKIRLFKSFIAPHINKYFRTNLYYMPEATMENRLGQPDSFKDVLMVKLDPIDDPQSRAFYSFLKNQSGKYGELLNEAISDILKNKLSEKYTHFMTLGDTEYDYADEKTGLPPVITGMDYDTQYETIKKKILAWKKTDDIDYDTHQKNIQANLIKAQLRNIGARKAKAGDNSMLGNVILTTEKTNGRVVYDKTFTISTSVQDFISKNEKNGIRFNPEAEFGKLRDGSGTQVLKLYYSWSDKFDKNTFVVIRKPRMSTISKSKISEWHSSDLEVVKNLDRNTDVNLFNEMLRGTHVYQWLKNNKSVIENRDEFIPIREHFSYVGKSIRMTGKNFNDEIASFRQLWKTIESGYEGELGMAIQAHTDVPLLIAQNTRTTNINTDNNGDLITHAQEIHVPYSFVDVTSLEQPSEPVTQVVQEQESTLPVKKISRGIGRARNMVKGMSGNEQRIVREQAEDIIRKMLGEHFLEGRTEFPPFLQHGLLELYGLMENGTIKLELNEKGVEITSPRHEVFHVVYNYCLDEKMRVRLLNEAKEAMKSIPSYANGYITNEMAEEWMARKFGERELVPEHKTKSPWYTPSGLLQRFIDFIEGIYKRFMDSRSDIEKLFRSIENGKYSDMPANIYETGEDIERPNAKISDDSRLTSLLATARENMNDAGEITTDVDMDEGIGNPNQVKMDYNYLHQLFGSMSDVHAMRRHYGYLINQNSIFNNSATFAISDYDQLIRDFEQYAINESNSHHNQRMSNGKLMQDITTADIPELNKEEVWDYQDYITGRQDEEGRAMVYRTIVNSIFPDYTFPAKAGEKGTFGKYASDSIQLNWEQVDPDKSKSKLMRWQLEITPLHQYFKNDHGNMVRVKDKDGKPEAWDEQSFVNVPDLERSMKEAAATIRQRIINDPLDEWDYEYLFFDELRSIAERLGGNNPKSNNILSFLERFDSHESEEIDGEPQISLKDIRDEAYNNWQNDTQLERGLRISELINSIVSTNISLRQRHNTEMRISDTSFGKRYSLFKRSGNTHEEIKNDITTWVRNRVFTPGTSPVVKTSIRNALRGSDQYGKDKQYDISDKGLRFKNGNKFINLIEVKDGKVVFSDQINKTLLTGMVKFLGLKNLSKRTIEYMFDKSVKGSTPSDAIIEKLNDDMKFGFANYDGMSQDILAEGFLNMFRAIDDNITMTDALCTLQEKLEDKKITQDAFDTNKAKILNKGNYTQEIDSYMDRYGMSASGRDSQEAMAMTQDAEAITNIKLPKPTDFYNLFNIIGAVEGYVRGNDYGKWSYRPDGSKWYNFAPSSHLFDVVGEGSKYLKERFKKRELEAIKGGLLKESVFYSEEGGRPHYYNALLDPGSTMELYKLWDYTGLKSSSVGSIKPSTKDFVTMGFQAFVDGIKSGNKVQTLYIPITHMASTGSQLNVIGEWTFDNTGTNKLIRVKVDENGQIESAILVDQMVNNEIVREFYARNRRAQVSRNKWCDFLQSGPWKSAFKNVTANLKPAAFEKAFDEAHKAFFSSATEEQKKAFAINLERSDLGDNGTDYTLKWNKERTAYASLVLGKDTLFNDNPIYNRDNMDKINKGDGKFTFTTEMRDEIFEKEFKKYAAQLASHNFELPNDVASLLPNKQYYTLENNTDKSSRIVKYNPVAQAQFYAFHIANNALGPLTFGHENLFKDNTEKSKRSAPHNTGGDRSNTTSKYGWGKNIFTITVHDRIFKDPVTGKEIEKTADGLSWGNILIKPFMKHAFGGDTFAPYGNTQQKDIYNNVNLIIGRVDQHKESIDYTTSDLYRNSVMHREMTEIMIKHTDEMMQQVVPNWGFTLWDMFQQYYEESGPVGERDADKAAEKLYRWIIEESGYAEQIKNRLVWKMQNKSASKGSNSRINEYNPYSGITTGYVSKGVWTDDVKIVLNPYQDIQDDKRLALPTQILQYLGVGSQGNILKAMSIAGKLAKIYKIGKKAIDDEIENMKIDHNKLSQKDIYYSKLDAYMRKKGIDALDAQSGISNYAELITNPKITTDVPALRQKLLQAYKNYVNKKCIKVPWRGLRMNQSTGEVFKIFEKGDQVYMLRDIEKMLGRELTSVDITAGTIEVNGESYTIRDLKSMSHDGEKLNRGEVVMPVSQLRNFGIRQNETLVDVYTIRFMDGSSIDLRTVSGSEMAAIQNKIDRGMDDSYTEGTLTYTEDEKKGIIKLVDIEHSPAVRWMLNKNGDYIEDNTLAVYTGAIGRLLDAYANRVPANRLGSGAMSRVVGLINDNGNNIYIPVGMTILNDSDFDIDQLSVYLNQLDESNMISESKDTITGLQNSIMTDIEEVYSDEGNKDNIFIASDIQNLRDLAQKTEDEQRQAAKEMEEKGNVSYNNNFTTDNMFATTIEDYDVTRSGNNAIGIIANTISGLAYMATLGPRISELAPGFKSFAERIFNKGQNSAHIQLGNFLQAALDNAKELILGRLGITQHAVNMLAIMTMDGKTNEEIADFFSKEPVVKKVFREVDRGDDVENSSREYTVLKVIAKERKKLVQGLIDKKNNSVSIEEKKELQQEIMKYGVLTASEEAIYKSDVEESRKKFTELNKKAGGEFTRNHPLYREYEEAKKRYDVASGILSRHEKALKLRQLEQYALKAEALRRLVHFTQMRNGLQVLDFESENFYFNTQMFLGQKLPDYLAGVETDISRRMNYWMNNNDEYLFEKDPDVKAELYRTELEVQQMMDIGKVLRVYPQYQEYLTELQKQKTDNENMFIDNSIAVKTMAYTFLKAIEKTHWDFRSRRAAFYSAFNNVKLDHYFKMFYSGRKMNLGIPYISNDEYVGTQNTLLNELRLDNGNDREFYKAQFPQFVSFLQDVIAANKAEGMSMLRAWNKTYGEKEWDNIVNNEFLNRLIIHGNAGMEYVIVSDSMGMTDTTMRLLSREFKKMPKDIQELFTVNELMNNSLEYRKGGISEIMGTAVYEDVSTALRDLKQKLAEGTDADKKFVKHLADNFMQYVAHENKVVSYLRKEERDKSAQKGRRPLWIKSWSKVADRFMRQSIKKYNPDHPLAEKSDGYYTEYRVLSGRGMNFDRDLVPVTSIEAVHNFTVDELLALRDKKAVTKQYYSGHDYHKLQNIDAVREETGEKIDVKPVQYYITQTGDIIRVDKMTPTEVVWVHAGVTFEQLQRNISKQTKYRSEHDLTVKQEEVHTGRKEYTVTDKQNKGYDLDEDGRFDPTGLIMNDGMLLSDKYNAESTPDEIYNAWRLWGNENPELLYALRGIMEKRKTLYSAMADEKSPVAMVARLLTEGYGMYSDTRNIQAQTEKASRALDMLADLEGSRLNAEAVQAIIGKIKVAVPGINIIEETSESVLEKGFTTKQRSWIDGYGFHINIDNFHSTTPVHEIGHIFTLIVKEKNPELYQQMYEEAERFIRDDDPIVKAIRRNYDLEGETLVEEVMNTIGGFYSRDAMESWLMGENVTEAVDNSRYMDNLWGLTSELADKATDISKDVLVSSFVPTNSSLGVKEGVDFVFEFNPELANAVYEALGLGQNRNYYEGNVTPEPNTIFVFGSNPEGRHGAGAAKIARTQFGAIYGQGEGLQGNAYALPTKDLRVKENRGFKSISPEQIIQNIKKLYEVAKQNPNKQFKVAYRNTNETSLNGYTGLEMIEMFNKAGTIPSNIVFSKEWIDTNKLNTQSQITPQQKQQAQQLYSSYLDTIFPNSKVKDIVYHGSNKKIEQFEIRNEPLIHFGTKSAAQQRGSILNQVILNIENLQTIKDGMWFLGDERGGLLKELLDRSILTKEEVKAINEIKYKAIKQSRYFHEDYKMALPEGEKAGGEKLQQILKNKNIGFEYVNYSEDKGSISYAVVSNQQIHILGSKQDIEGFKAYLKSVEALSLPIQSMTLQRVFNALTGLLLSNKTIVDLKDSDNQKIFYASLGKDPVSSIALTEKTPITNIKDFAGHFNNNASDTKNPEVLKEEQFVNYLYDRIISSTRWNGKYHFEVGGQGFEWKENIGEEELKKSIRDKVVPAYSERKAKLPGQTMQFINLLKEKKTVEEAGKIAFGENTYPLFILNQLANTLYANEKIIAVHRYSELRNHENKTLSEIYNPAFEGYDPLVFVHEGNTGKLVVSLFDITPDPLGFSGIKRSGNHLLSPYISGAKYNELGGSYSNEDRDIRKVLLGMTVMAMRDKVPNMVVRNLSVVKFNKSKLENNPVSDVKELVHEIDIIRKQKPLMDAIDNPEIISILSNDKNYDANIEQSFIQRLINNLSMSDNNENGGWVRKQYFDTLIKEGVTRQDIKRILVRMQKQLEEKYGSGTPALYNDNEYQVIGRALRELETGYIGWINSTKDMGTVGKYLINRHNINSDVIQWIQRVISDAKQKVVEYVRNYQKDIHDLAQDVIREYELKHPEIIVKERTVNTGSDYFRHLYKTKEVKISSDQLTEEQRRNGITTETVIIPEVHYGKWTGDHWEFDDPQTEKLYREGKLNDTDLKYTEKLLDVMEKRWKANIKHDNNNMLRNMQVDGKEGFNDGDTEKLFISHYRKGMVPVMSKEVAELMGKMSTVKIGVEKKLEQLANWDSLFSDNLGGDYKFDKLSNNMNSQLFNEQVWLGKMGLVRTANGYELFDRNRNKAASTNLSYTSDYFMMEGIRKEVYENEVIPEYNSAQAIFAMLENDPKDPQKQANNKEYLRIYFERAVHHKNQDPKETGIDTPFGKVYFKQAARSIQHLYGFLSLGFKPMIAIKSMVFNMTKLITEPMVVKLADMGVKDGDMASKLPSTANVLAASQSFVTDFKKARELAYLFQLIDRQERDVLESRFTNLTEKRWLSEQFAHVGNWATDAWARMISMIAWMKNEGSWDAYSINKETGEIEYDETKDKRFYDESGKLKTANHEDVILQGLKERLIAQGTMKDDDTKLTRGHDYTLSDTTFKWFADKFIVGSMDDMSKVIAGTSYWGAFLTQFRLYSFDRLWTMGFNASTRESEWGAGFKAVQDEQGNWVSQKDRLVIEGMLQSYSKALKAIINVKNEGLGEWWGKQSAMRRMNIIRGAVQLALGAALLAMFKSWKDDKDGFDEKKLSWVISELFFAIQIKDMLLNPIPLLQGATDLWDMVAGRKNVEGLLRYTGPVGGMLDIEKQYENLKGETDDVKFDF